MRIRLDYKYIIEPNADYTLTVLLPKFLTLQFRYAVFPNRAVTFLEAALSNNGPPFRV